MRKLQSFFYNKQFPKEGKVAKQQIYEWMAAQPLVLFRDAGFRDAGLRLLFFTIKPKDWSNRVVWAL